MIKVLIIEKIEGDYAKFEKVVTFFGIPLYKHISYTTNDSVINQFKVYEDIKVKGFNNED